MLKIIYLHAATFQRPLRSALHLLLFALCTLSVPTMLSAEQTTALPMYCEEPQEKIEGVVLLVHGLNNAPKTLRALREIVREQGFISCQLRLSGHTPGIREELDFAPLWRKEVRKAAATVTERYPALPFVGLGYSLGGALVLGKLQDPSVTTFSGVILLAPAITLRWKTYFLRALSPLRFFGLSLPSMAPADYRVHDSTSLRHYHATLSVADEVRTSEIPSAARTTPLLLVVSSEDELIDSVRLVQHFKQQQLLQLQFLELRAEPKRKDAFHHLLLDADVLGEKEWARLRDAIEKLLQAAKRETKSSTK